MKPVVLCVALATVLAFTGQASAACDLTAVIGNSVADTAKQNSLAAFNWVNCEMNGTPLNLLKKLGGNLEDWEITITDYLAGDITYKQLLDKFKAVNPGFLLPSLITMLTQLGNLKSVSGDLVVKCGGNQLMTEDNLEKLVMTGGLSFSVKGDLILDECPAITSFTAFQKITEVQGSLEAEDNANLRSFDKFKATGVSGLRVERNQALQSLNGLEHITPSSVKIQQNGKLANGCAIKGSDFTSMASGSIVTENGNNDSGTHYWPDILQQQSYFTKNNMNGNLEICPGETTTVTTTTATTTTATTTTATTTTTVTTTTKTTTSVTTTTTKKTTAAPTTAQPTTVAPTTEPLTVTKAGTTLDPTTVPPTTAPVTTVPVTTAPVTTAPVTTAPVTTVPAGTTGDVTTAVPGSTADVTTPVGTTGDVTTAAAGTTGGVTSGVPAGTTEDVTTKVPGTTDDGTTDPSSPQLTTDKSTPPTDGLTTILVSVTLGDLNGFGANVGQETTVAPGSGGSSKSASSTVIPIVVILVLLIIIMLLVVYKRRASPKEEPDASVGNLTMQSTVTNPGFATFGSYAAGSEYLNPSERGGTGEDYSGINYDTMQQPEYSAVNGGAAASGEQGYLAPTLRKDPVTGEIIYNGIAGAAQPTYDSAAEGTYGLQDDVVYNTATAGGAGGSAQPNYDIAQGTHVVDAHPEYAVASVTQGGAAEIVKDGTMYTQASAGGPPLYDSAAAEESPMYDTAHEQQYDTPVPGDEDNAPMYDVAELEPQQVEHRYDAPTAGEYLDTISDDEGC